MVYTSSTYTIGEGRCQTGDETTLHRGYFYAAYEEAKYRAEQVALEYAGMGLPVVIVNPGGAFGPGGLKMIGEPMVQALKQSRWLKCRA